MGRSASSSSSPWRTSRRGGKHRDRHDRSVREVGPVEPIRAAACTEQRRDPGRFDSRRRPPSRPPSATIQAQTSNRGGEEKPTPRRSPGSPRGRFFRWGARRSPLRPAAPGSHQLAGLVAFRYVEKRCASPEGVESAKSCIIASLDSLTGHLDFTLDDLLAPTTPLRAVPVSARRHGAAWSPETCASKI